MVATVTEGGTACHATKINEDCMGDLPLASAAVDPADASFSHRGLQDGAVLWEYQILTATE